MTNTKMISKSVLALLAFFAMTALSMSQAAALDYQYSHNGMCYYGGMVECAGNGTSQPHTSAMPPNASGGCEPEIKVSFVNEDGVSCTGYITYFDPVLDAEEEEQAHEHTHSGGD